MNEMLSRAFFIFLGSQLVVCSDLPVKCASGVIVGRLGSSVVLPCWLDPPLDVEAMEIRWYRPDQYNTPVLLSVNQNIMTDQQGERYRHRTSLSLRNGHSTGLKGGDVSLRLDNLTVTDQGIFHCFVSGEEAYGSGSLVLNVTALGSSPVISLQPQGDMVNVTCKSCGWLPKPELKWMSYNDIFRPGGLLFIHVRGELTCVHSWILLSPSNSKQISCSISLSGGEERDGHVDIQNIVSLEPEQGPWKTLFALSFVAALSLVATNIYFYSKHKKGYESVQKDDEAVEIGTPKINMAILRNAAVCVTLDTTHYPSGVKMRDKIIRDDTSAAKTHKGPAFPYHLSVRGQHGFSSGRAYWEVELKSPNIVIKKSWLIGVTNASDLSKIMSEPTPSGGFWFIYSSLRGLHANTQPEILLPVFSRPEIVGVFLDYDEGELSFYNAKVGTCLLSMKVEFKGKVVPIFNPGIGDDAPLRILELPIPKCSVPAGQK